MNDASVCGLTRHTLLYPSRYGDIRTWFARNQPPVFSGISDTAFTISSMVVERYLKNAILGATGAAAIALAMFACTPNAPSGSAQISGAAASASIIEVSLLQFSPSQTAYGTVAGYSPNPLIISVGATIQFHNRDSFAHTAT
ncbi:MAG: hypothetical protein GIW99_11960, partial [Candidatus Eremiobacteraeota bacterium]|nr:hypothetical protein [Candidatus Eremiobacteraeota bacterium]